MSYHENHVDVKMLYHENFDYDEFIVYTCYLVAKTSLNDYINDFIINVSLNDFLRLDKQFNLSRLKNNTTMEQMCSDIGEMMREVGVGAADITPPPNGFWPEVWGPILWGWLHIITIYLDENVIMEKKREFLIFVSFIVGCSVCRQHYLSQLPTLFTFLNNGQSLENIFLMLHTNISGDGYEIIPKYKSFYQNVYKRIRAHIEQ